MALTFAAYSVPDPWQRPAAVAAVALLAAVNYRGITRTAQLTRVIVTVVLLALGTGVLVSLVCSERPFNYENPRPPCGRGNFYLSLVTDSAQQ